MRAFRSGLLVLGAAFAVLAALAGAAFSPVVQTWAARRWLAAHPSWHASVDRVSAGLEHWQVRNLRIQRGGVVLTFPSLEAEMPTYAALAQHRFLIRELVATDWTLRLVAESRAGSRGRGSPPSRPGASTAFSFISSAWAAAAPPDPAAAARVFRGLIASLELPADLKLDALKGEGLVLLPPPPSGGRPVRARLSVAGGGLAAGATGHFTFALTQLPEPGAAAISAVAIDGTAEAAMDGPRTFRRLGVRINAAASGEKFPSGVRLSAELGAARLGAGETYTVKLTRDHRQLADLAASLPDEALRLDGAWKLDVSDRDLSPFALGRELPRFDLVGAGHFDADTTLHGLHVSGGLKATLDRLEALEPTLAPLGRVHLDADFDLTQRGRLLRVDHLRATLAGAQPILTLQALQAFAFNAQTGELQVADAGRDLLSIQLQAVPLEWGQPFLPGLALTGSPLQGDFIASARHGSLFLHSKSPVAIGGLAVARNGRLWVQRLNVAVTASADYTPLGWQLDVQGGTGAVGPRPPGSGADRPNSLVFSAKVGRLAGAGRPVKVTGNFRLSLPALAAQPALERLRPALRAGTLSGDFSAGLTGERFLQAKLVASGLEADPAFAPGGLPGVSAEVRADAARDGSIAFSLPLVLEREGRKSDLTLEGTLAAGASRVWEGRVSSNHLALDDLKLLAALGGAAFSPAAGDPSRGGGTPLAAQACWAGCAGRVTLALKRVDGPRWSLTEVKGAVGATPAALWLDHIQAGLTDGSAFTLDGGMTFAAGSSEPYALQADLGVSRFDPAPIFHALNPDQPPTVEGRCDLTAHFTGRGASPSLLASGTRGEFSLTSRGGTLRALGTDLVESIRQAPSRLSEAVDSVVSLFGKSNPAQPIIDKQGQVVVQITEAFKEIHYDQLHVTASRDADLNFRLTEFAVISPEIRLGGTGRITYQEGVPIPAQPLDLTIAIGARGRTGDLMASAGLLSGRPDGLGYTGLVEPVHLGGSLDDIDQEQWKELLVRTALRKAAGGLINKLLGK